MHKFEAVQLSLAAIRDDRVAESIAILGDDEARKPMARDRELEGLLADWFGLPEPRKDFLSFAHNKRKASET